MDKTTVILTVLMIVIIGFIAPYIHGSNAALPTIPTEEKTPCEWWFCPDEHECRIPWYIFCLEKMNVKVKA
jgi:hypothetical protein